MLRSIEAVKTYTIQATDGQIGQVSDFYFDDREWTVRYLVVDTGGWLPGRKVLISRLVLGQPDWEAQIFPVGLTKAQVEDSPDIDLARPVSRQQELELHQHYQWPLYWSMPGGVYYIGMPLTGLAEAVLSDEQEEASADKTSDEASPAAEASLEEHADWNLRSTGEVVGYQIKTRDGEAGQVADFIVDDETWIIRYMVVETLPWGLGRQLLISPLWTEEINWNQARVEVNLFQESLKNAPDYDPTRPINREYEARLYDYYGRPRYWK